LPISKQAVNQDELPHPQSLFPLDRPFSISVPKRRPVGGDPADGKQKGINSLERGTQMLSQQEFRNCGPRKGSRTRIANSGCCQLSYHPLLFQATIIHITIAFISFAIFQLDV
jgi:hypothetical protein